MSSSQVGITSQFPVALSSSTPAQQQQDLTDPPHQIVEIVGADEHRSSDEQQRSAALSDQDVVDITAKTIKQEKIDEPISVSPNRWLLIIRKRI